MTTAPDLVLYRTDSARNMARFYAMSLQPSLFGDVALLRRWDRIGTVGASRVELHRSEAAALQSLERHAASKMRRGYRAG